MGTESEGRVSDTDHYCTPAWLTARLPDVHLDPCSNPRSTVRSARRYMLEFGHDGLALPWEYSVFINHPYSDPMPWMRKLSEEIQAGRTRYAIVLAKHDHSTSWWQELVAPKSDLVMDLWQLHKRVQFDPPPGITPSSNNFCSSVVHWRKEHLYGSLPLDDVANLWRKAA